MDEKALIARIEGLERRLRRQQFFMIAAAGVMVALLMVNNARSQQDDFDQVFGNIRVKKIVAEQMITVSLMSSSAEIEHGISANKMELKQDRYHQPTILLDSANGHGIISVHPDDDAATGVLLGSGSGGSSLMTLRPSGGPPVNYPQK